MNGRRPTSLSLFLLLVSWPVAGCGSGCARSAGPDAAPPAVAARAAAGAPAAAPAPAAPLPAELRPPPDGALTAAAVLALRPYTEVPALGTAVRQFNADQAAACADTLGAYLAAAPETPLTAQATYLLGVCLHFAGRHTEAAAALGEVAPRYPLLADYARYFAAASLHAAGRPTEALGRLREIPDGSSQARRASELETDILAAGPDAAALAEHLQRHLKRFPDAPAALRARLARALEAAGRPGPAAAAWLDLRAQTPTSREAREAPDEVKRLARALPEAERRALTGPDPARDLRRTQRLFDAHRSREAIDAAGAVTDATARGSDPWCEATHLAARSWDKLRQRKHAVPLYDALLKHCEHHSSRVDVLFFGGKSAHQHGLRDRALEFFAKLHREFPEHSYNDDALLREADIHTAEKRPKKATAALERALAEYPDGDMREDVSWLLFWDAWTAGDWGRAAKQANRNLALVPRETSWNSAGRTLYWKGRALAKLGEPAAAAESWRAALAGYPLSWYAGLSYARLAELDPAAAKATVAEVVAADRAPAGPLASSDPLAVTTRPAFRRGLELLRLGLTAPAQRELATLHRVAKDDPAAGWLLAAVFADVGDYVRSHDIARRQRGEFADHWPTGDHARYWRIAYPLPYETLVARAAATETVPPALVHAIMREESGFNPDVESWANAVGLLQLLVGTAEGLRDRADPPASRESLKDPRLNVKWGTRFLGRLLRQGGEHPALAATGYNAGAARLRQWLSERGTQPIDEFVENIPFGQTRGYTKRVIESYLRYRYLYGPDPGQIPLIPLTIHAPK